MHPDTTAPNPLPFADARGWQLSRLDRMDGLGSSANTETTVSWEPTAPARIRQLNRIARAWQLGLVAGLIIIGPTTAASILFALTAH